ncbi:MAG: hypothetical protein HOL12_03580 [Kordiimonadaceae bacterium]|nr:hypothetical protein [Kordiimonadaceae bacterium]
MIFGSLAYLLRRGRGRVGKEFLAIMAKLTRRIIVIQLFLIIFEVIYELKMFFSWRYDNVSIKAPWVTAGVYLSR